MTTQPALFHTCPLPGCRQPVDDPRVPCQPCLDAFGLRLQPGSTEVSPEQYAAQIADRDRETAAILAARKALTAALGDPIPEPAPEPAVEWKNNQRCWVCEERRRCRPDPDQPGRLICRACLGAPR